MSQCSRCDGQRKARRQALHQLYRPGEKQAAFINRAQIERCFTGNQVIDEVSIRCQLLTTYVRECRDKAAAIIEAEIFIAVVLVSNSYVLLSQDAADEFQVQWLVVNDHTVEVKDDGLQHKVI